MKKILIICFILAAYTLKAQPPTSTYQKISGGFQWSRGYFEALNIPVGFGAPTTLLPRQWNGAGGIYADTSTTPPKMYIYSNGIWYQFQGSSGGGTNNPDSLAGLAAAEYMTVIRILDSLNTHWLALSNKEPSFLKNTAFNKNFGSTLGTVAEGDDIRINNGQIAFSWGNHFGLYKPVSYVPSWSEVTGKDAYPLSTNPSNYLTSAASALNHYTKSETILQKDSSYFRTYSNGSIKTTWLISHDYFSNYTNKDSTIVLVIDTSSGGGSYPTDIIANTLRLNGAAPDATNEINIFSKVGSSSYNGIKIYNNDGNYTTYGAKGSSSFGGYTHYASGILELGTTNTSPLYLSTNGTMRMQISGAGLVTLAGSPDNSSIGQEVATMENVKFNGTVNSGAAGQLAFYGANGKVLSGLGNITPSRVLVSDGSGYPVASSATNNELSYVIGGTGPFQGQINTKANNANTITINGNSQQLGNNPSFTISGGGEPTLGGDLQGLASNAQIVPNSVGSEELSATGTGTGTFSNPIITVDVDGRITDIANSATLSGPLNGLVETEFYTTSTTQNFLFGAAISSGTITSTPTANAFNISNPGIVRISAAATPANSGYKFTGGNVLLNNGVTFDVVAFIPANVSSKTYRIGFTNTSTVTTPTIGLYINWDGTSLTLQQPGYSNVNLTDQNFSLNPLLPNEWYRFKISCGTNRNDAYIYNMSGTLVSYAAYTYTGNMTSVVSPTIMAFSTGTTASEELLVLDYARLYSELPLNRGF